MNKKIINKIKTYTFKIKCFQTDTDTSCIKLNGKEVDDQLERMLWEILDMHRHNLINYPEEKPTIEGAFSEIAEEYHRLKFGEDK